jgi:hypothetical protein
LKNKIISPDSNNRLIVYPTKKNILNFGNTRIVVLATEDEEEIVNFIRTF